MTEQIDLSLNLDSTGYVQGAQAISAASQQVASSFDGVGRQSNMLQRAMNFSSPIKRVSSAFSGAVTTAGEFEQRLAGMQATAKVTGQSMAALQTGMQGLARTFPVGNAGALEVVSTLQQIGMSSKNQIGVINQLGKSFINLGAATGTNAAQIGRQMVNLNRAFGASDNNVKRFNAMSDSLTTVTAKIGGSATEIAAFSKNIAPMARSAGIGQNAVMGISAAFSKMGEDGFIASNAMNKMLTDMNRSVRDGSSEMGTYANIVGKTREEFEALFKADPAKALSTVMDQLGGGGPGSERNLERLGLDGVRTARALQSVSQQGGLQPAIDVAVAGTGTGVTEKAAKSAMDGLVDEFTKLQAASAQVAEALGRPFLDGVTKVVKLMGAPTKMAAAAVDTPTAQWVLGKVVPAVTAAASGYLAIRAMGALGLTSAFVRQFGANNGIIRGILEGRRTGASAAAEAGPVTKAMNEGKLQDAGLYGKAATGAVNLGRGFGMAQARVEAERANVKFDRALANLRQGTTGVLSPDRERELAREAQRIATTPGPSMGDRARSVKNVVTSPRNWLGAIGSVQRVYNNAMMEPARQLRQNDPTLRGAMSKFKVRTDEFGNATHSFGKMKENLANANASAGSLSQRVGAMGGVMLKTGQDTMRGAGAVRNGASIVYTSLMTTANGLRALAATAGAVSKATGLAGAAKSVGSMIGGPMAAMMAGSAIYNNVQSNKQAAKDERDAFLSSSVTSFTDDYRDALGGAAASVSTFAEQIDKANQALLSNVSTMEEATSANETQRKYAEATKDQVVKNYGSASNESIAEQIKSALGGRQDLEVIQGITVDLMRQGKSQDQARSIMDSAVSEGPADYAALFKGVSTNGAANSNMDQIRRTLFGQGGDRGKWGQLDATPGIGGGLTDFGGFMGLGNEVGVGGNKAKITEKESIAVETAMNAIGSAKRTNEDQYSPEYARQEELRAANAVFAGAAKTNDADLIATVSQRLADTIGAKAGTLVTPEEAAKAGGYVNAVQAKQKDFREKTAGVDLNPTNGTAGLAPVLNDDAVTQATEGIKLFGKAMSNRAEDVDSALNKVVKSFTDLPGNMERFRKAINGVVAAGQSAGMSLAEVGRVALQTSNALNFDPTSDDQKLSAAVFDRVNTLIGRQASTVGTGETLKQRMITAQSLMDTADESEQGQANYMRGEEEMFQAEEEAKARLRNRLIAERQFQISSRRAWEDYHRNLEWAMKDFQKNLDRSEIAYEKSRSRSQRDFNLSMKHGQEDYLKARMRAHRDFNKQLRRMNEDAAKSMYDPYKRIQVQAISDYGTLMVNLREQNQMMVQQARNLDELRARGVNNDVIDQLGLNKSTNAQQTQRLLDDIMNGASAADINRMIAERMAAAKVLNMDEANKDITRGREDFESGLRDMEKDFLTSVERSNAAFEKSMVDMAFDYQEGLANMLFDFQEGLARQAEVMQLGLTRQREDIEESQKELLGTLEEMQEAVFGVMAGEVSTFDGMMKDTLTETLRAVKEAKAELAALAGEESGSYSGNSNAASGNAASARGAERGARGSGGGFGGVIDSGEVTSRFGMRNGRMHKGIDIGAPIGTPIKAYTNGEVAFAGVASGYGKVIYIDHGDGRQTRYAHLNGFAVQRGDSVRDGEVIGQSGNTGRSSGPHLHFETLVNGKAYNPEATPFAMGGIATRAQIGLVAEAGSPEAMIPLNSQGVSKLAEAMTQFITGPQIQRMMTAGHGDKVVFQGPQIINSDHSTNITGPVTVQAQDPNAMMRALQAKARSANLTATPTRKGR